jgi:AcrR family transcriptional regulator
MPAAQRRAELLAAALDVFADRGYHGTSIDDVAKRAGVSKALIYEHFASKRELHETLLSDHAAELFRRFRDNAARGLTGEARLRGGLEAFFSFVEDHQDAWRALFRDQADPELRPVIDRLQDQATGVMTALLGDEEGDETLGRLLSGAAQGLANWWLEHPETGREEIVERTVAFCWLGLERLGEGDGGGGEGVHRAA